MKAWPSKRRRLMPQVQAPRVLLTPILILHQTSTSLLNLDVLAINPNLPGFLMLTQYWPRARTHVRVIAELSHAVVTGHQHNLSVFGDVQKQPSSSQGRDDLPSHNSIDFHASRIGPDPPLLPGPRKVLPNALSHLPFIPNPRGSWVMQ